MCYKSPEQSIGTKLRAVNDQTNPRAHPPQRPTTDNRDAWGSTGIDWVSIDALSPKLRRLATRNFRTTGARREFQTRVFGRGLIVTATNVCRWREQPTQ